MGSMKYRPQVSTKNKYWISKHRFYEISHHCYQYDEWKDELRRLRQDIGVKAVNMDGMPHGTEVGRPTESIAVRICDLEDKIKMVEQAAIDSDPEIAEFILKAVTEDGITFNYLKNVMGIPCERDMYYDRRRKFYWIMSQRM